MLSSILRILWGIVGLLSIAWIAMGFAATADIIPDHNVVADLDTEVEAIAGAIGADEIAGYSPLAFYLVSGLPVLIIAAFFFRRNGRRMQRQRAQASSEQSSEIPEPFPEKSKKRAEYKTSALRRQSLAVTAFAFVAVFLLWNNRDLELILYPLRLFVTFVHEAGHALAALISGGEVQGFTVSANGSGYAVTAGGNRALIIPAGYLGAALFGSLLFLLCNRTPRWLSGLAIVIGAFMIGITAIYARPDESGSPLSMFIGIGFGLAILLLGAKAPLFVNQFALSTLAVLTALEAVLDLWYLVGNSSIGRGEARNDAVAFSQEITPLLPASVIALIWAAVAIGMLAASVYYSTIKPLRREIGDVINGQK